MKIDMKKDSRDISVDTSVKKSRDAVKRLLLLTAMLLILYTGFTIQAIPVVHPRTWVIIAGAVMTVGFAFLIHNTFPLLVEFFAWLGLYDDNDEDDNDDIF